MSPNWFLNMASPILNVPIHLFFPSVLIGKFVCCDIMAAHMGLVPRKAFVFNKIGLLKCYLFLAIDFPFCTISTLILLRG